MKSCLDGWEREQIDKYIREGGRITVITPAVKTEMEEADRKRRERWGRRNSISGKRGGYAKAAKR